MYNSTMCLCIPLCLTNSKGSFSWKGPRFRITVYVDSDHGHDLLTRRSIAEILVMLNNTPIRWIFKHQKTVQTSSFVSEFVASRIATELIIAVRCMLRSLGVVLDGSELMLGDKMSSVWNNTVSSRFFKTKESNRTSLKEWWKCQWCFDKLLHQGLWDVHT
jgi:hypothetical protein